jgi:hypothetical protein
VTQDGRSQTFQGWAGYQDRILTLAMEQGPPLVGKLTVDPAGSRFVFKPPVQPESAAGLSFEKAAGATTPPSGT